MCLPDFVEFKEIDRDSPIIGYRNWRINIKNPENLISLHMEYIWDIKEIKHDLRKQDSGIYSYNNNYYNYYYYNNNYYRGHNNYYNYEIFGIIHQHGKVAIHKTGYRSEYAKVITLFTIRELDAKGSIEFLDRQSNSLEINWIKEFNLIIQKLAEKYGANTIHYQDFQENKANE